MGAHKAQQVIGCLSWKSRKSVFVGIYRTKMRTNGNYYWGDNICPSSSGLPVRHPVRSVSVLNLMFRRLRNFFCQCVLELSCALEVKKKMNVYVITQLFRMLSSAVPDLYFCILACIFVMLLY